MKDIRILVGDVFERLAQLPDESVHCVVTSPPYWGLRAYGGEEKMIGLEATFDAHLDVLVRVFREVRRVLRPDGTLWLNYGDAYAGVRPATGLAAKQLLMMPARVALALQTDGWWLRSEIVWAKPNPMPESVTDRPTSSHEKIFLLTKSARYFYDAEAVRVPCSVNSHGSPNINSGRKQSALGNNQGGTLGKWTEEDKASGANLRNVWTIATHSFLGAHFATFPPKLVEPCIKAGTSEKGCCVECGAPWNRTIDTPKIPDELRNRKGKMGYYSRKLGSGQAIQNWRENNLPCTIGWTPACDHNSETTPCTVLDPFGGSGTVGLVADRLDRDAILIELNPEYAEMARRRIHEDAPLFTDVQVDKESHETSQLRAG